MLLAVRFDEDCAGFGAVSRRKRDQRVKMACTVADACRCKVGTLVAIDDACLRELDAAPFAGFCLALVDALARDALVLLQVGNHSAARHGAARGAPEPRELGGVSVRTIVHEIETIVGHTARGRGRNARVKELVLRWKGYDDRYDTVIDLKELQATAPELVKDNVDRENLRV